MMIKNRLARLRDVFLMHKIDGYFVPRRDEFFNDFSIADYAKRLEYVSGFTGSAGDALILKDHAYIFVDGRYELQVMEEVLKEAYQCVLTYETPLVSWIRGAKALEKQVIGFDPWLFSVQQAQVYREAFQKVGADFVPMEGNLVDVIWEDAPKRPSNPIVLHPLIYTGETVKDKIARICHALKEYDCYAYVVSCATSLAWALNIRGADISYTPVALMYGIVYETGKVDIFCELAALSSEVKEALKEWVVFYDWQDFSKIFAQCAGKRVGFEYERSPSLFMKWSQEKGVESCDVKDPCVLPQACKNKVEIEGARRAHIADAIALAEFFAWLEESVVLESISEIKAQEALQKFREAQDLYQQDSFPYISASGPNGAVIHYRARPDRCRTLNKDILYLIDSGGQYLDGTTDVTRVIALKSHDLSSEIKKNYTLVLKGLINLSTINFPKGTTGHQLDILAREFLWREGLDYQHGSGHGVGSYLGVHEEPQRIARGSHVALQEGMIVSNEPGYYLKDQYGIRIENLMTVVPSIYKNMLSFETLTFVPVSYDLIQFSLLKQSERDWLNEYHAKIFGNIYHLVSPRAKKWLKKETHLL